MVRRPVAFDAKNIPPLLRWMDNGQVDSKATAPDLSANIQAPGSQCLFYRSLERRISFSCPSSVISLARAVTPRSA